MKKYLTFIMIIGLMLCLTGCGNTVNDIPESVDEVKEVVESVPDDSIENLNFVPIISSLILDPSEAFFQSYGGSVTVKVNINFIDSDGDVEKIYFQERVFDIPQNKWVAKGEPKEFSITGIDKLKAGVITISVIMSTLEQKFTFFNVWVDDSNDNKSNILAGSFRIR